MEDEWAVEPVWVYFFKIVYGNDYMYIVFVNLDI